MRTGGCSKSPRGESELLQGKQYLHHDAFYAAPALSGSRFEDLLASFGQHQFFKAAPPDPGVEFHWRADIVAGSDLSIWRTRFSADWSYSSETSEEDLGVGFIIAGAAEMVVGTSVVERTPSTLALMPFPTLRQLKMKTVDGSFASVLLRFDARIVAKKLMGMFDCAALTTLDLVPLVDLSTNTGRILLQLARVLVSCHHDRQLMRSPKAMALLTEAILQLIFENVPHRLLDRANHRPPDILPRHVQQAIDYMHANLHLTLTMIDIADAIGVSDRSLQLGFRKFRNTTPAAYLRRIRLEAVHAELSLAQNELPVHEVAGKWGFAHMGRFAARYRAMYGVYPSETVKRSFGRTSRRDS